MTFTFMQRHPRRFEALASGELIDVTAIAREDTFRLPIAITKRAWETAIALPHDASDETLDEAAAGKVRLLLRTAFNEIQKRWEEDLKRIVFPFPHNGDPTNVIIVATTDNDGEPVLTIGLPEEFLIPDRASQ